MFNMKKICLIVSLVSAYSCAAYAGTVGLFLVGEEDVVEVIKKETNPSGASTVQDENVSVLVLSQSAAEALHDAQGNEDTYAIVKKNDSQRVIVRPQ
jgi:hypothetical protein